MWEIFPFAKQRAFVRSLDTELTSNVPGRMNDEEDSWNFEDIVTAKEVGSSILRAKLQEVQRVCENGGEVVPTTVVELAELAREGVEAKLKMRHCSNETWT